MKQILSKIFGCSLLALSLVACSSGEDTAPAGTGVGTTPSDSVQEEAKDNTTDSALRVGIDLSYPPYSYLDDGGQPAGFEPDLAIAFGEFIGQEVEIVDTSFGLLLAALDMDDLDILIADMSINEERQEKADFSDPYRYEFTLALVNADFAEENNVSDAMTEDEFFAIEGANFIGRAGTKGVYYPQSKNVEVTEVTEIGTGLVEISTGMADILIASNEIHSYHAADPDNTVVYSGIPEQSASCFVVKKGNSELLAQANEFIDYLYEEDGGYDQMKEKFDPIIGEFLQNEELGLDYITYPNE